MNKRYDFSESARNRYLSKAKRQVTIRLDEDTSRTSSHSQSRMPKATPSLERVQLDVWNLSSAQTLPEKKAYS